MVKLPNWILDVNRPVMGKEMQWNTFLGPFFQFTPYYDEAVLYLIM
jgi:hypothetical protein